MRPRDTTVEAQRVQWKAWADLDPARRFTLISNTSRGLTEASRRVRVERSLESFVADITEKLDGAGIDYMIVGSVAAGIWAAPRYAQDLDFVVEASEARAGALAESFDDRYNVGDLLAASRRRDRANVILPTIGWKADLIWTGLDDWDRAAFARRRRAVVDGRSVWVIAPEDLVIAKLLWASGTGSEMQLRDVMHVLAVADIDRSYLEPWIDRLDLRELLARAEPT